MALTPIPPIEPVLPDPPNPLDDEATFDAAAYAWSAALPGFGSDLVDIGLATYANAGEALTAATTATDKAVLTAADRVQTGLDRVQTGLDAAAAADMDKRYLGAKSTAPTLDNQGAALQAGAVYYDTTTLKVMTWSGSSWVEGISAVAGVTAVNGNTGAVTLKTVNSTTLLGSGDIAVQPTLVSGTSIKTVNSTTLLGSGDIAVQPTLVSGTNIKTVNGTTLLGSGNATIVTGSLVYLLSVTGTNAATIDVEHAFNSTYDEYIIVCTGLSVAQNSNLYVRFKNAGAYDSTVANYSTNLTQAGINTDYIGNSGSGVGSLRIYSNVSGVDPLKSEFTLRIIKPYNSSCMASWDGQCSTATYTLQNTTGSGKYFGSGPVTGFRFFMSAGNISSATFHLYGVKKS